MDVRSKRILISASLALLTLACNLPLYLKAAPVPPPTQGPAILQTTVPEAPEQAASPTVPATDTSTPAPSSTSLPTSTSTLPPVDLPTGGASATATANSSATASHTPTSSLTPSRTGTSTRTGTPTRTWTPTLTFTPSRTATPQPPTHRASPAFEAAYAADPPPMDGSWAGWNATAYPAGFLVYGGANWGGEMDLGASFRAMWDEYYLYVACKVADDSYVQASSGSALYLGDSVEILVDTAVQPDFWTRSLDGDDFQVGASPGKGTIGSSPEAYLWYPRDRQGSAASVRVAAVPYADGYRIAVAIPWSLLGVRPAVGMHLGFAVSASDDDSAEGGRQQSMVSSSPGRILTDPTSWGDLLLK